MCYPLSCRSGELTADELSLALERLGWPDERCSIDKVAQLMDRYVQQWQQFRVINLKQRCLQCACHCDVYVHATISVVFSGWHDERCMA
jgi:hypothetical protein